MGEHVAVAEELACEGSSALLSEPPARLMVGTSKAITTMLMPSFRGLLYRDTSPAHRL